jgi:hypothetical protein
MAEKLTDVKVNINNISKLSLNNYKFRGNQWHGKKCAAELCKALNSSKGIGEGAPVAMASTKAAEQYLSLFILTSVHPESPVFEEGRC